MFTFFGAAFAHNFGLASSGAGPTANGKVAVIIGLVVVTTIGLLNMDRSAEVSMRGDVTVDA